MTADPLVRVQDLSVHFPARRRKESPWRAIDRVNLEIPRGTTVGLVGESGSGKTTLGRSILRRVPITAGSIAFDGRDITDLQGEGLRRLRRRMQVVFQNPVGSLNPKMTILENIAEPLIAQGECKDAPGARDRVVELLDDVGLRSDVLHRYPHQFSGGQCQRVGIARALTVDPDFIVADEPVASLDVSVQAQIVNLLDDLRRDKGGTLLFIAHDLAVVRHISDEIATMYAGRLVEVGDADSLYTQPRHPYTDALLSAIPVPDPARAGQNHVRIETGEAPRLNTELRGCAFASRCPFAVDECHEVEPQLREVDGHRVACHRAEEITLNGI